MLVAKLGENQLLTLNASSLDDRFSFENDKISVDAFNLLMSMVFDANVDENGLFYPQDIDGKTPPRRENQREFGCAFIHPSP
ncbi:MAG: hypothetical protein ACLR6O_00805 [Eubacterium sp.]